MDGNLKSQIVVTKKSWVSHIFITIFLNVKKILSKGVFILLRKLRPLSAYTKNNRNKHTGFFPSMRVSHIDNNKMLKETSFENTSLNYIANALSWPEILDDVERENGFRELLNVISLFSNSSDVVENPSNCWILLAVKNYDQLLTHGFNNFKRTIGHNYFNFLVKKNDIQIETAEQLLKPDIVKACSDAANLIPLDPDFNTNDQFSYYYFVLLLWEYVKSIDKKHYIDRLEEPKEGNPILIYSEGKKVSQDLANSLIEYYSISEVASFEKINSVLEIGGGYGRNAFTILTLNPEIKVTLVDIPPALYVAQRYLSSIFKDRKIFKARNFSSYAKVKKEMAAASIIFLLPHQLALIPDNKYDLCMNISSFGEMQVNQLEWYFKELDRLTKQYLYTKQWNISKNPFDGIELKKSDYPYPNNWKEIYSRSCPIQTDFFEAVYELTKSA